MFRESGSVRLISRSAPRAGHTGTSASLTAAVLAHPGRLICPYAALVSSSTWGFCERRSTSSNRSVRERGIGRASACDARRSAGDPPATTRAARICGSRSRPGPTTTAPPTRPTPASPPPSLLPSRSRALGVELALGLPQRRPTTLRGAQLLGQLIATRIAVAAHPPPRRSSPPPPRSRSRSAHTRGSLLRRVRRHLRPIDRDHADLHQPRPRTHPEHIAEQPRQRRLVPLAELRDRRMIRHQFARSPCTQRPPTLTLDPPRGPVTHRVRVQQQRHHHRRVIRRPTMTIRPIRE